MKTRFFLRSSSALGIVFAFGLPVRAFARAPHGVQPAAATKVQKGSDQQGYIRELRDKSGNLEAVQTVIRRLVNEWNKAVLADLKTLIQTSKKRSPHRVHSIAVFYGAGHMKDMEQHLISDLGYRAATSQWLTAIQAAHGPISHK